MYKHCPFCHQDVPIHQYPVHEAQHTRLLPDGQMTEHVTVRPEERFAGSIVREPQWYIHPRCGGVTGMPEEIIRSYIADPFLYNDSSFCTGCNTYVPTSELYWQETNESLLAASYRRKAEFIKQHHLNPDDFVWDSQGPVRRKSRGGGWGVAVVAIGALAALFLLGFVFLFGIVAFRAAAARPRPAPPAANAFPAAFNQDFPRADFPRVEIPQGPDLNEMMREQNERMDQIRRQHDKLHDDLMERLHSDPIAAPAGFGPGDGFGRPAGLSGIDEARARADDARQRAQERIDASRKRMRSFP